LRRFSVAEYHRMIALGILHSGDPIELLEGFLVFKVRVSPPHATVRGLLDDALRARLPDGWRSRQVCAITTQDSEPEPDLAVIRGPLRKYAESHPRPEDAGLVVQVADVTLAQDRGQKLRVYAAAGIALYWIVNIPDNRIEVYTQPTGTGEQATYAQVQLFGPGDDLALVLGGVVLPPIPVRDILP
jgi:Uma2 family endonuclease